MGIEVPMMAVLCFAIGLALLYVVGGLLVLPLRSLLRFLFNGVLGGALLVAVNLFGAAWGLSVAINPFTALVAGFLGVPGAALMIILARIL